MPIDSVKNILSVPWSAIIRKEVKTVNKISIYLMQNVGRTGQFDDTILAFRQMHILGSRCPLCYSSTGHFIMLCMITNIYNKKTKGPALMELFTATGKLKKVFFDN
jgi:hypothetical protein